MTVPSLFWPPSIPKAHRLRYGRLHDSGLFAEELIATPRLTEGPFYPDKLPLDTDNDLLVINDSITPAVGQITHLGGCILGPTGQPIRNAIIEIWQVDQNGAYIHSADSASGRNEKNFQGYGRFLTDSKGQYYFRTIRPVPYPAARRIFMWPSVAMAAGF